MQGSGFINKLLVESLMASHQESTRRRGGHHTASDSLSYIIRRDFGGTEPRKGAKLSKSVENGPKTVQNDVEVAAREPA